MDAELWLHGGYRAPSPGMSPLGPAFGVALQPRWVGPRAQGVPIPFGGVPGRPEEWGSHVSGHQESQMSPHIDRGSVFQVFGP